jgi:hypothetical protein
MWKMLYENGNFSMYVSLIKTRYWIEQDVALKLNIIISTMSYNCYNHCLFPNWDTEDPPSPALTLALSITDIIRLTASGVSGPVK